MSQLARLKSVVEDLRHLDLERMAGLRPSCPPVAVEIDRREIVLVRLQRGRRGNPVLEAHQVRMVPDHSVGASIFRPNLGSPEEFVQKVRDLFEGTGTRPGRVSLVLPDNLAKVSLITLPERPASRKQLLEIIRFKLRRSVPFRLEDSLISHQVLPSEGKELTVLVALMLRAVVEQYEQVLESIGARPGLVELCTLSLFNLCRAGMAKVADGRDVALLNCAYGYFALIIVRDGRLIFYRCKSLGLREDENQELDSVMARELASSFSYYQEKLGGQGIGKIFLRSLALPPDEVAGLVDRVGFGEVVAVDPSSALGLANGLRLDPAVGQRIAPAVGAASRVG